MEVEDESAVHAQEHAAGQGVLSAGRTHASASDLAAKAPGPTMIAKHIAMNAASKNSFVRLVRYLTDEQGKEVRTGAVRISNCFNNSAEVAALEVLNTQLMNTRSAADKPHHLVISFRCDEHTNAATLAAIEERICDALGFIGHQRVSVVHDDADNLHLHVAINKIHPRRYTIHEPFRAYRTMASLCDTLKN
jgi:hypothetical protein